MQFAELTAHEAEAGRVELLGLYQRAAAAGIAPGFAERGAASWNGWHVDQVLADLRDGELRVFVLQVDSRLAAVAELRRWAAAGWGGWEPWKRHRIENLVVAPGASDQAAAEFVRACLQRLIADLVLIDVWPGSVQQRAAQSAGFVTVASVPDLLIGPRGAPAGAELMAWTHPKPSQVAAELLAKVEAVPPSVDGELLYRPCVVDLQDGRRLDRVYVQEAWSWKQTWGIWPEDDNGKAWIRIGDVLDIASSPMRLAPDLATRLLEAGESGMGYTRFTVVMRDGRRVNATTGNAVDFPSLPTGATGADVVDVIPHQHVGDPAPPGHEPPYWWCLYVRP